MVEGVVLFVLGIFIGVMCTLGIGIQWFKAKPERIKAAIRAIIDSLAQHHPEAKFEVYGTLVSGSNSLAVKVYVEPESMTDAINEYADKEISRIRSRRYEHPTSQKDPSCKAKEV